MPTVHCGELRASASVLGSPQVRSFMRSRKGIAVAGLLVVGVLCAVEASDG